MLFLAYIYGNIMKIETTGASEATAKQDKLTIKGENAWLHTNDLWHFCFICQYMQWASCYNMFQNDWNIS